jgi:hypothetical protein
VEYIVVSVFVGLFGWAAYRQLQLSLRGIRTTGTIVDMVQDEASDGPAVHLVVQFTTATGAAIRAKSYYGMERVNTYYRIGEQVHIRYSDKDPQVFSVEGHDVAGLFLVFLVTAGVVAICYYGSNNGGH